MTIPIKNVITAYKLLKQERHTIRFEADKPTKKKAFKGLIAILALHCKRYRRRVLNGKGRWENVFPQSFVTINLGYDQDYDCLMKEDYDGNKGEYPITYWAPPRIFGTGPISTFSEYMANNKRFWASNKTQILELLHQPIE